MKRKVIPAPVARLQVSQMRNWKGFCRTVDGLGLPQLYTW